MTTEEARRILTVWSDTIKASEASWEKLNKVIGVEIDGPLWGMLMAPLEPYTDAVALLVGDYEHEWIPYFWHECRLGDRPKAVRINDCDRPMETIDDLLWALGYKDVKE